MRTEAADQGGHRPQGQQTLRGWLRALHPPPPSPCALQEASSCHAPQGGGVRQPLWPWSLLPLVPPEQGSAWAALALLSGTTGSLQEPRPLVCA